METYLRRLVLVRHGEAGHEQVRYVGKTDVPLSPQGRLHSERLAKSIKKMACTHALSSPLRRCLETAEVLLKGTDLMLEQDPDLREIDFGRWEGLTFQEIVARDPQLVDQWARGSLDFCFPDGETLRGFWDRICRAAKRLREIPAKRVLVVTHGGVIRFLLCHYLGLDTQTHLRFEIRPASITQLHFKGNKAVLVGARDFGRV